MKRAKLEEMNVEQLVQRFVAVTLAQDEALLMDEYPKFNRLFGEMEALKQELKARDGDQRKALLGLYEHPNAQVRVKAATATLAVAPEVARRALQVIADSQEYPQAGEAGLTIAALEDGTFRPT
jgi:hypothetical protein